MRILIHFLNFSAISPLYICLPNIVLTSAFFLARNTVTYNPITYHFVKSLTKTGFALYFFGNFIIIKVYGFI